MCQRKMDRDSPHSMFGEPLTSQILYKPPEVYKGFEGDRILIAVLGYGYNQWPFYTPGTGKLKVLDEKNFASETAPVCNGDIGYTLPWLIHDYTKTSHFVICRTTCDDSGTIANGATAKAIKWLREQWKNRGKNTWKVQPYNNLIILIPYGGQYMKDEMMQITEATAAEGIIIVCAAGGCREGGGGDVVFPAALGTVISVGVAGTGPRGREIDVSIDFSKQCGRLTDVRNNRVYLPSDCGYAAAIITGLLSLILSRINATFKADTLDHNKQEVVKAIEKKCPYYVHTCIIRELLVNKGNGSHDPQLGYGDGKKIIADLLKEDILKDLADIILIKQYFKYGDKGDHKGLEINDDERNACLHDLTGDGVIIAVFDEKKPENSPDPGHGEKCKSIVKEICPSAAVWTDFTSKAVSEMQRPFIKPLSIHLTDVVSCSIAVPSFDYNLCTAVNKAVMEGKIIVFAAGNYGQSRSNTVWYPGRIGNILVVGGRNAYYSRVDFSSVGREMDFLAEALQFGGGTSFAAPVVAGYIALLLQFIKEEMKDDTVSAWSKDPDTGEYQWRNLKAFDAARNNYAMRALLKLLVPKPQIHSETEGFGCLDVSVLLPTYEKDATIYYYFEDKAKKKIQETLQKFYKRQL